MLSQLGSRRPPSPFSKSLLPSHSSTFLRKTILRLSLPHHHHLELNNID